MLEVEHMDGVQLDILKEIGNIGAGNATTALAKMLNKKLDMQVPVVKMVDFQSLSRIVGGEENLVVAIYLMLDEDIEGSMMFVLPEEAAHTLVNDLLGRPEDDMEPFTEMDLSAMQEIGNIITGAYLVAISSLTGLTIGASVPYLSIDMAAAVLSVPAIEFGKMGDHALLIQTQFGDDIEIDGYFILMPAMDSYGRIMSALGF